jgi:hypothetical protein
MTFLSEKQSFFTKELTNICPLLAASGGSLRESVRLSQNSLFDRIDKIGRI